METFDFKSLTELPEEEFESKFKGKRIRVTTHGKTTEGIVISFPLSIGSNAITGFTFDNNCEIHFMQDIKVEVLNG